MKKVLTLIYTIYDFDELQIENINYVYDKSKDIVDIIVLSDNPESNYLLSEKLNKNINLEISNKNIGKYQLVKNAVKNDKIKTKWFKICDPDDNIYIENLFKFNTFFQESRLECLIKFIPSIRVKKENWNSVFLNSKNNKLMFKKNVESLVNENTVHVTKHLKEFELDAYNQTKCSDILLSLSSITRNDFEICEYDESFYIYTEHNGISSTTNSNNTVQMIYQLINYLKIIQSFDNSKFNFPSFYDYKWAHNYILSIDIDIETKIILMNEIFDILSVISKNNKKWKVQWSDKELKKYISKLEKGKKIK